MGKTKKIIIPDSVSTPIEDTVPYINPTLREILGGPKYKDPDIDTFVPSKIETAVDEQGNEVEIKTPISFDEPVIFDSGEYHNKAMEAARQRHEAALEESSGFFNRIINTLGQAGVGFAELALKTSSAGAHLLTSSILDPFYYGDNYYDIGNLAMDALYGVTKLTDDLGLTDVSSSLYRPLTFKESLESGDFPAAKTAYDLGISLGQFKEKTFPIVKEDPDSWFDFTDPAFYQGVIADIGSSFGTMGAMKLAQVSARAATKLGTQGALTAASKLGASNISNIGEVSSNLGKFVGNASGIASGAFSEAMTTSLDLYNEIYNDISSNNQTMFDLGLIDENQKRILDEEGARKAGIASKGVMVSGIANLFLQGNEMKLLSNPFRVTRNIDIERLIKEESRPLYKKVLSGIGSESLEESITSLSTFYGKGLSEKESSFNKMSVIENFFNEIKPGQLAYETFIGGLAGGIMSLASDFKNASNREEFNKIKKEYLDSKQELISLVSDRGNVSNVMALVEDMKKSLTDTVLSEIDPYDPNNVINKIKDIVNTTQDTDPSGEGYLQNRNLYKGYIETLEASIQKIRNIDIQNKIKNGDFIGAWKEQTNLLVEKALKAGTDSNFGNVIDTLDNIIKYGVDGLTEKKRANFLDKINNLYNKTDTKNSKKYESSVQDTNKNNYTKDSAKFIKDTLLEIEKDINYFYNNENNQLVKQMVSELKSINPNINNAQLEQALKKKSALYKAKLNTLYKLASFSGMKSKEEFSSLIGKMYEDPEANEIFSNLLLEIINATEAKEEHAGILSRDINGNFVINPSRITPKEPIVNTPVEPIETAPIEPTETAPIKTSTQDITDAPVNTTQEPISEPVEFTYEPQIQKITKFLEKYKFSRRIRNKNNKPTTSENTSVSKERITELVKNFLFYDQLPTDTFERYILSRILNVLPNVSLNKDIEKYYPYLQDLLDQSKIYLQSEKVKNAIGQIYNNIDQRYEEHISALLEAEIQIQKSYELGERNKRFLELINDPSIFKEIRNFKKSSKDNFFGREEIRLLRSVQRITANDYFELLESLDPTKNNSVTKKKVEVEQQKPVKKESTKQTPKVQGQPTQIEEVQETEEIRTPEEVTETEVVEEVKDVEEVEEVEKVEETEEIVEVEPFDPDNIDNKGIKSDEEKETSFRTIPEVITTIPEPDISEYGNKVFGSNDIEGIFNLLDENPDSDFLINFSGTVLPLTEARDYIINKINEAFFNIRIYLDRNIENKELVHNIITRKDYSFFHVGQRSEENPPIKYTINGVEKVDYCPLAVYLTIDPITKAPLPSPDDYILIGYVPNLDKNSVLKDIIKTKNQLEKFYDANIGNLVFTMSPNQEVILNTIEEIEQVTPIFNNIYLLRLLFLLNKSNRIVNKTENILFSESGLFPTMYTGEGSIIGAWKEFRNELGGIVEKPLSEILRLPKELSNIDTITVEDIKFLKPIYTILSNYNDFTVNITDSKRFDSKGMGDSLTIKVPVANKDGSVEVIDNFLGLYNIGESFEGINPTTLKDTLSYLESIYNLLPRIESGEIDFEEGNPLFDLFKDSIHNSYKILSSVGTRYDITYNTERNEIGICFNLPMTLGTRKGYTVIATKVPTQSTEYKIENKTVNTIEEVSQELQIQSARDNTSIEEIVNQEIEPETLISPIERTAEIITEPEPSEVIPTTGQPQLVKQNEIVLTDEIIEQLELNKKNDLTSNTNDDDDVFGSFVSAISYNLEEAFVELEKELAEFTNEYKYTGFYFPNYDLATNQIKNTPIHFNNVDSFVRNMIRLHLVYMKRYPDKTRAELLAASFNNQFKRNLERVKEKSLTDYQTLYSLVFPAMLKLDPEFRKQYPNSEIPKYTAYDLIISRMNELGLRERITDSGEVIEDFENAVQTKEYDDDSTLRVNLFNKTSANFKFRLMQLHEVNLNNETMAHIGLPAAVDPKSVYKKLINIFSDVPLLNNSPSNLDTLRVYLAILKDYVFNVDNTDTELAAVYFHLHDILNQNKQLDSEDQAFVSEFFELFSNVSKDLLNISQPIKVVNNYDPDEWMYEQYEEEAALLAMAEEEAAYSEEWGGKSFVPYSRINFLNTKIRQLRNIASKLFNSRIKTVNNVGSSVKQLKEWENNIYNIFRDFNGTDFNIKSALELTKLRFSGDVTFNTKLKALEKLKELSTHGPGERPFSYVTLAEYFSNVRRELERNYSTGMDKIKDFNSTILNPLGITIKDEALRDMIYLEASGYNASTTYMLFSKALIDFSPLYHLISSNVINTENYTYNYRDTNKDSQKTINIFKTQHINILRKLSELNSRYDNKSLTNSARIQGKSYYNNTYSSPKSNKLRLLKFLTNPDFKSKSENDVDIHEYRKQVISNIKRSFFATSYYVQLLLNKDHTNKRHSAVMESHFKFGNILGNSVSKQGKFTTIENTNITSPYYYINRFIGLFSEVNNGYSTVLDPTHSDKTTLEAITVPYLDFFEFYHIGENNRFTITHPKTISRQDPLIQTVVLPELKEFLNEITNILVEYSGRKDLIAKEIANLVTNTKFYVADFITTETLEDIAQNILRSFKKDPDKGIPFIKRDIEQGYVLKTDTSITEDLLKYDKKKPFDKNKSYDKKNPNSFTRDLLSFLETSYADLKGRVNDLGLLDINLANTFLPTPAIRLLMNNHGVVNETIRVDYTNIKGVRTTDEISLNEYLLMQMMYNYSISNAFFNTLPGNPNSFRKGTVEKTQVNIVKRLQGFVSPGTTGNYSKNEYYTLVIEDDISRPIENINSFSPRNIQFIERIAIAFVTRFYPDILIDDMLNDLKTDFKKFSEKYPLAVPLIKPYLEITVTDGTEIMLEKEALDSAVAYSQMTPAQRDKILQLDAEIRSLKASKKDPEKLFELEEQYDKLVNKKLQPGKYVYFGENPNNNVDYFKNASIPGNEDMFSGNPGIQKLLRVAREDGSLQRITFTSACKSITPDIIKLSELQTLSDERIRDVIRHNRKLLNRSNLRSQIKFREKEEEGVTFGTQQSLIIFSDIEELLKDPTIAEDVRNDYMLYQQSIKTIIGEQIKELVSTLKGHYDKNNLKAANPVSITDLKELLSDGILKNNGVANLLLSELKTFNAKETATLDSDKNPVIPFILNPDFRKIEPMLWSIVNKSMTQFKANGIYAVQHSEFGMINTIDTIDPTNIDPNNQITWITPQQGIGRQGFNKNYLDYDECVVPWPFKEPIESFINQSTGLLDLSRIDPELLVRYAYRIPSQGANSMIGNLRVVGFLPRKYGDLVITSHLRMPHGGWDFDADKLFVYEKYHTVENEKYVVDNSTPSKQSFNNIIDVVNRQLERKFFDSIYPNTTGIMDQAVEKINKVQSSANRGSFISLTRQEKFFFDNSSGKTGVGIFSNLSMSNIKAHKAQLETLPMYVLIDDEINDEYNPFLLNPTLGSSNVRVLTKIAPLESVTNPGEKVSESIQHSQTASLDNAKDPKLGVLGLTPSTMGTAGMLQSMGIDLEFIGLLMNQPLIKLFFNAIDLIDILYDTDTMIDLQAKALDMAIDKLLEDPRIVLPIDTSTDEKKREALDKIKASILYVISNATTESDSEKVLSELKEIHPIFKNTLHLGETFPFTSPVSKYGLEVSLQPRKAIEMMGGNGGAYLEYQVRALVMFIQARKLYGNYRQLLRLTEINTKSKQPTFLGNTIFASEINDAMDIPISNKEKLLGIPEPKEGVFDFNVVEEPTFENEHFTNFMRDLVKTANESFFKVSNGENIQNLNIYNHTVFKTLTDLLGIDYNDLDEIRVFQGAFSKYIWNSIPIQGFASSAEAKMVLTTTNAGIIGKFLQFREKYPHIVAANRFLSLLEVDPDLGMITFPNSIIEDASEKDGITFHFAALLANTDREYSSLANSLADYAILNYDPANDKHNFFEYIPTDKKIEYLNRLPIMDGIISNNMIMYSFIPQLIINEPSIRIAFENRFKFFTLEKLKKAAGIEFKGTSSSPNSIVVKPSFYTKNQNHPFVPGLPITLIKTEKDTLVYKLEEPETTEGSPTYVYTLLSVGTPKKSGVYDMNQTTLSPALFSGFIAQNAASEKKEITAPYAVLDLSDKRLSGTQSETLITEEWVLAPYKETITTILETRGKVPTEKVLELLDTLHSAFPSDYGDKDSYSLDSLDIQNLVNLKTILKDRAINLEFSKSSEGSSIKGVYKPSTNTITIYYPIDIDINNKYDAYELYSVVMEELLHSVQVPLIQIAKEIDDAFTDIETLKDNPDAVSPDKTIQDNFKEILKKLQNFSNKELSFRSLFSDIIASYRKTKTYFVSFFNSNFKITSENAEFNAIVEQVRKDIAPLLVEAKQVLSENKSLSREQKIAIHYNFSLGNIVGLSPEDFITIYSHEKVRDFLITNFEGGLYTSPGITGISSISSLLKHPEYILHKNNILSTNKLLIHPLLPEVTVIEYLEEVLYKLSNLPEYMHGILENKALQTFIRENQPTSPASLIRRLIDMTLKFLGIKKDFLKDIQNKVHRFTFDFLSKNKVHPNFKDLESKHKAVFDDIESALLSKKDIRLTQGKDWFIKKVGTLLNISKQRLFVGYYPSDGKTIKFYLDAFTNKIFFRKENEQTFNPKASGKIAINLGIIVNDMFEFLSQRGLSDLSVETADQFFEQYNQYLLGNEDVLYQNKPEQFSSKLRSKLYTGLESFNQDAKFQLQDTFRKVVTVMIGLKSMFGDDMYTEVKVINPNTEPNIESLVGEIDLVFFNRELGEINVVELKTTKDTVSIASDKYSQLRRYMDLLGVPSEKLFSDIPIKGHVLGIESLIDVEQDIKFSGESPGPVITGSVGISGTNKPNARLVTLFGKSNQYTDEQTNTMLDKYGIKISKGQVNPLTAKKSANYEILPIETIPKSEIDFITARFNSIQGNNEIARNKFTNLEAFEFEQGLGSYKRNRRKGLSKKQPNVISSTPSKVASDIKNHFRAIAKRQSKIYKTKNEQELLGVFRNMFLKNILGVNNAESLTNLFNPDNAVFDNYQESFINRNLTEIQTYINTILSRPSHILNTPEELEILRKNIENANNLNIIVQGLSKVLNIAYGISESDLTYSVVSFDPVTATISSIDTLPKSLENIGVDAFLKKAKDYIFLKDREFQTLSKTMDKLLIDLNGLAAYNYSISPAAADKFFQVKEDPNNTNIKTILVITDIISSTNKDTPAKLLEEIEQWKKDPAVINNLQDLGTMESMFKDAVHTSNFLSMYFGELVQSTKMKINREYDNFLKEANPIIKNYKNTYGNDYSFMIDEVEEVDIDSDGKPIVTKTLKQGNHVVSEYKNSYFQYINKIKKLFKSDTKSNIVDYESDEKYYELLLEQSLIFIPSIKSLEDIANSYATIASDSSTDLKVTEIYSKFIDTIQKSIKDINDELNFVKLYNPTKYEYLISNLITEGHPRYEEALTKFVKNCDKYIKTSIYLDSFPEAKKNKALNKIDPLLNQHRLLKFVLYKINYDRNIVPKDVINSIREMVISQLNEKSSMKYSTIIPRDNWVSEKYKLITSLPETDPAREFYEFYIKTILNGRKVLPYMSGVGLYYINEVKMSIYEEMMKSPRRFYAILWDRFRDYFAQLGTQLTIGSEGSVNPITGKRDLKIPIYGFENNRDNTLDTSNLGRTLLAFQATVNQYKIKEEVLPLMDILEIFIDKLKEVRMDNKGNLVKSIPDAEVFKNLKQFISNHKSAFITGISRKYDPYADSISLGKMYTTKDKIALRKSKETLTELEEELETIKNDPLHSPLEIEDLESKIKTHITKQKFIGRSMTVRTFIDALVDWIRVNKLSFNMPSAINDGLYGMFSLGIESGIVSLDDNGNYLPGSSFYDDTTLALSYAMVFGNSLTDTYQNITQQQQGKMEYFSVIFGLDGEYYKEANFSGTLRESKNVFEKFVSTESLWAAQKISGTFNFMVPMVAILKTLKVKLNNGTMVSYWDLYSGPGVINPKYKDLIDKDPFSGEEGKVLSIQVSNYIKSVIAKAHGNMDQGIQAKSNLWGRVLLLFKSFLAMSIDSRIGNIRFNQSIGEYTSGRYRSVVDVYKSLKGITKDYYKLEYALTYPRIFLQTLIGMPITNQVLNILTRGNIKKFTASELEKIRQSISDNTNFKLTDIDSESVKNGLINMKIKNAQAMIKELYIISFVSIIWNIIDSIDPEDDEFYEDSRFYMLNQLARTNRDLLILLDPREAKKIVENPVVLINSTGTLFSAVSEIYKSQFEDEGEYDPYDKYDHNKVLKKTGRLIPGVSGLISTKLATEEFLLHNR